MLLTSGQIPADLAEFFEPAECGECFVCALVGVFREVRRVLRDDGTVWLNLGDSYAGGGRGGHSDGIEGTPPQGVGNSIPRSFRGTKPKDLLGVPWLVAFALRTDGWYLRSEIIWHKPNPMPESVTDRPTKAHEQVFLLSKRPTYFFDADAIREADSGQDHPRSVLDGQQSLEPTNGVMAPHVGLRTTEGRNGAGRNKRSVWTVATQPYAGAHFATFPPKLIEPCILAGCPERCCSVCGAPWERVVERERWNLRDERRGQVAGEAHIGQRQRVHNTNGQSSGVTTKTLGFEPSCTHNADPTPGTVLDPFAGAGTTGMVALRHGRSFVGIELNPEYAQLARERIVDDCPLWNAGAELAA